MYRCIFNLPRTQSLTLYFKRFSGISEEDVKDNCTSLREVQETLLSFISADTILIGHGLETDLCALKVTTASFFNHNSAFLFCMGLQFRLKKKKAVSISVKEEICNKLPVNINMATFRTTFVHSSCVNIFIWMPCLKKKKKSYF